MEESPWGAMGKQGRQLDFRGLARLLKPYGIAPGTVRQGESTVKGYRAAAFTDAWSRYLPPTNVTPSQTSLTSRGGLATDPSHPHIRDGSTVAVPTDDGLQSYGVTDGSVGEGSNDFGLVDEEWEEEDEEETVWTA